MIQFFRDKYEQQQQPRNPITRDPSAGTFGIQHNETAMGIIRRLIVIYSWEIIGFATGALVGFLLGYWIKGMVR